MANPLEHTERKAAHGRAEDTPVIVHNVLFVAIGFLVGVIVLAVFLIYYLA